MAALADLGYRVAPFKVGPDFIDPGHHRQVTGKISRNLDGWMLSRNANASIFARHTQNADIAVVEGVMGLFDGYDGKSEAGSTAQMAKWLGLSVVLVVDARSMARSAAALVQGFERFDRDLRFAGVLFNRIGSPRHLDYLRDAMDGHVAMPVLGGLMRNTEISIPERHLGLKMAEEHDLSDPLRKKQAAMILDQMDLNAWVAALPTLSPSPEDHHFLLSSDPQPSSPESVRIGVARDAAFCFYYADNLELLEAAGARLVFFSPLSDGRLPENLGGLYLGGGYPELYARTLSENRSLVQEIRHLSQMGMPIYGECGGFMYLCEKMGNMDGEMFPMTGCLPFSTRMLDRLRTLGYREVTLSRSTLLGPAGQVMRGHEFHYSTLVPDAKVSDGAYTLTDRSGITTGVEGFTVDQTLGSYVHLHFKSCPEAAENFVAAARQWKRGNAAGK